VFFQWTLFYTDLVIFHDFIVSSPYLIRMHSVVYVHTRNSMQGNFCGVS